MKYKVDGVLYNLFDDGTAVVAGRDVNDPERVIIPRIILKGDAQYTVTSILSSSFLLCKNIKEISIPDSVTSIGDNAFDGCIAIESIVIPDSVTHIGMFAFAGCTGLKRIEISANVSSINMATFDKCLSLEVMVCRASVPPETHSRIIACEFYPSLVTKTEDSCILYVPDASVKDYKNDPFWNRFKKIRPLSKYDPHEPDYRGILLDLAGILVKVLILYLLFRYINPSFSHVFTH